MLVSSPGSLHSRRRPGGHRGVCHRRLICGRQMRRCVVLHETCMVLGTRSGAVYVLDHVGNEVSRHTVHTARVNDVGIDTTGKRIISCGDDGKMIVCNAPSRYQGGDGIRGDPSKTGSGGAWVPEDIVTGDKLWTPDAVCSARPCHLEQAGACNDIWLCRRTAAGQQLADGSDPRVTQYCTGEGLSI